MVRENFNHHKFRFGSFCFKTDRGRLASPAGTWPTTSPNGEK